MNMSHMARWNSALGRCGDREKRSRWRAISEREDPLPACPRVAMGIAPLMEHRLTFSQSSKGSIRHKGGE